MTRPFTVSTMPAIRAVLNPELASLADEALDAILAPIVAALPEADRENFKQVGQTIGRVAPGALAGAAGGATAGLAFGPYGALIGGLLGAGASVAQQLSQPQPRRAPPRRRVAASPPRQPAPVVAAPSPTPPRPTAPVSSPNVPAAQLLSVLSDPALVQSLLALVLGPAGAPATSVGGGAQASPAALLNLVSVLANRTVANASATPGADSYLFEDSGSPKCNMTDRHARADLLLAQLEASRGERVALEEWPDEDAPPRIVDIEVEALVELDAAEYLEADISEFANYEVELEVFAIEESW